MLQYFETHDCIVRQPCLKYQCVRHICPDKAYQYYTSLLFIVR